MVAIASTGFAHSPGAKTTAACPIVTARCAASGEVVTCDQQTTTVGTGTGENTTFGTDACSTFSFASDSPCTPRNGNCSVAASVPVQTPSE